MSRESLLCLLKRKPRSCAFARRQTRHPDASTRTMALQEQSPHKHNRMFGRQIPHPKATNYDEAATAAEPRPTKRQRRFDSDDSATESLDAVSSKDIQSEGEDDGDEDSSANKIGRTDLDSALPPLRTDEEAIEEYEAFKASQASNEDDQGQPKTVKWMRGRSSIYVDAFNLALDTVLEEESHLFDEPEQTLFKLWRDLSYEAQYL